MLLMVFLKVLKNKPKIIENSLTFYTYHAIILWRHISSFLQKQHKNETTNTFKFGTHPKDYFFRKAFPKGIRHYLPLYFCNDHLRCVEQLLYLSHLRCSSKTRNGSNLFADRFLVNGGGQQLFGSFELRLSVIKRKRGRKILVLRFKIT